MTNIILININVATDFTVFPGARYRSDGKFSGQEFYENLLLPKFKEVWVDDEKFLKIDFDGTFPYASSFISEVFTRLVREFSDKDKIKSKLIFKSDNEPLLINSIMKIIDETN